MESLVLSSAFSSLSIVYQAYTKIKSNKERCAQLVERCQLVVDRLQAIIIANGDAAVANKINGLEQTFKLTADTITKVGQQGIIASLLRTDENAALIEDCQHNLTQLVSLLNLEQIIDVSGWQRENEIARRRDHKALLAIGRKLEQGNAAILSELTTQGATLAELSDVVQSISVNLGEAASPITSPHRSSNFDTSNPEDNAPRPRSASSPESVRPRPSISSILGSHSNDAVPTNLSATGGPSSTPRNRSSWTNRLRISPLSVVSRLSPRNSVQITQTTETPFASRSPLVTTHSQSSATDNCAGPSDAPATPPPAYNDLESGLLGGEANDNPRRPDDTVSIGSGLTCASTEALRGEGSPTPSPGSLDTFDVNKPLPEDPVSRLKEAVRTHELTNFSVMRSIGSFGNFNSRVLVEMWMLPKIKTFNKAIPLGCFVPVERNNLELVKKRASGISESLHPMLNENTLRVEYNHVLMLCPQEAKPTVIVVKKHQVAPQQSIKAYVLETVEALTLVSVKQSSKTTWFLIPYYPDMRVRDAKEYIRKAFGNVAITACRLSRKGTELDDAATLSLCGVRSYEHNISMRVTSIV